MLIRDDKNPAARGHATKGIMTLGSGSAPGRPTLQQGRDHWHVLRPGDLRIGLGADHQPDGLPNQFAGRSVSRANLRVNLGTAPAAGFPEISNGQIKAKIYLPDAKSGYYRSTRFDWSGAVYSLTYKSHEFHGPWYDRIDPKVINWVPPRAGMFEYHTIPTR